MQLVQSDVWHPMHGKSPQQMPPFGSLSGQPRVPPPPSPPLLEPESVGASPPASAMPPESPDDPPSVTPPSPNFTWGVDPQAATTTATTTKKAQVRDTANTG